jgi:hypothetical protein
MTPQDDNFEDLEELEEDEGSQADESEPVEQTVQRRIFTDKLDPPVGSLHLSWKSQELILDPGFQRR